MKVENEKGAAYIINPTYKNYAFFSDRIGHIRILLTFSRKYKDGSLKTMVCEVPEEYMNESYNLKDIQALYISNLDSYSVLLKNLPIKVDSYAGLGFSSTKDLEDATLNFQLMQAPGAISKAFVKFRFPPDFSRINELLITNKGINEQGSFYSTYSLSTPFKIKY